jgi:D-lactate dehydrogenase
MEILDDRTLAELRDLLPTDRIFSDELTLSVYARDASLYRIVPQVVLKVETESEMSQVLALAFAKGLPVGFRAAGTSLSGQALTHGILILQGQGWRQFEVLEQGLTVRCGPGWRGSEVNARLKPYQRKIGPDPASIDAAKIGGIAANNASGMCCGTQHNTYQTMQGCRIIFSDGSCLDTSSEASRQNFRLSHAVMLGEINALAENLRCRPEWVAMIRHKYLIKNTTGYAINSFLDYSDPIDIIAHLMIGSEGTLGFIAEITYRTVPEYAHKSNALVYFKDIHSACRAVQALRTVEVDAIELMDTKALRAVPDQIPAQNISSPETTALLIEVQASDSMGLEAKKNAVQNVIRGFSVEVKFTEDMATYAKHWKIRKGMFPSVAAMRAKEETVIIEDIAFPVEHLAEGTVAVQKLFVGAGYSESIIFGHAQAGNLHIVFTQAFGSEVQRLKYQKLMDDLSCLVVDTYGGSLKAEHGTGRNMAPFVKKEWGADLYDLMKNLKKILDPKNNLNPGVVISSDDQLHLKNLKPMPSVHEGIDNCMECGFCERVCPSQNLSLTPRGRIMAMRELKIRGKSLQSFAKGSMEESTMYQAVDTCAADGMCAEVCPVKINTGKFIKSLRELGRPTWQRSTARFISQQQTFVEKMARGGLWAYHELKKCWGENKLNGMLNTLHRWTLRLSPSVRGNLPRPFNDRALTIALQENALASHPRCIVLYQSCINRVFGQSDDGGSALPDVTTALVNLATKSGYRVIMGSNAGGCCGLPYASKGFGSVAHGKLKASLMDLEQLTEGGRWPVVVDNSPCSQELKESITKLKIVDAVEWLAQDALEHLNITSSSDPLVLHSTCSARKMGLQSANLRLAQALSSQVIKPEGIECCGFAGDRGFSHPELNRSALQSLNGHFHENCKSGVTSSTTCGLGLTWNSGRPYPHLAQVLNAVSQKSNVHEF